MYRVVPCGAVAWVVGGAGSPAVPQLVNSAALHLTNPSSVQFSQFSCSSQTATGVTLLSPPGDPRCILSGGEETNLR